MPAAERDAQRLARNALKKGAVVRRGHRQGRMPLISANELNLEMISITGFHKTASPRVMNDSYISTTRGGVTEHTRATTVQLAPLWAPMTSARGARQESGMCQLRDISRTRCKHSQVIIPHQNLTPSSTLRARQHALPTTAPQGGKTRLQASLHK